VAIAPAVTASNEDATQSITLAGTDADNDALTYAIVTQPAHGTITRDTTNYPDDPTKYLYTPTANYNGADSFTFKVNDGTVDSAAVTVNLLTIDPANALYKLGTVRSQLLILAVFFR